MDRVRIDKWLWAARFFKSRSLATHACELGRIECAGVKVKPARDVRIGDLLQIRTDAGLFTVDVLGLSEMRGPASVAQALYRETEASREARKKAAEDRKSIPWFDLPGEGRPSKRNRRELDRLRRRY
jgi:ribosome-associated heat shock protein Hsp15